MPRRPLLVALLSVLALAVPFAPASARTSAATPGEAVAICEDLFAGVYDVPTSEPLARCQWDMALIAADAATHEREDGSGARVGVIDSGVDLTHPDIAANLDLARSCSFVGADTPTADPAEVADGDCSVKSAVQDLYGHGTHVASIIAAPVNGVGVAGVAPGATIVAIKACTVGGYCFVDDVAAALRYAGDLGLDVVNLSLFADPYLYYCGNEAEQRAMLQELQDAARYARSRGALLVAAAGNESHDLQHPRLDVISPDWPPGSAVEREVGNQCRVAPAELSGVVTVSATGPVGYPGYTTDIASYSSVGAIDVTAPGGDYFAASGTVQDAVLAAMTSTDGAGLWAFYDTLPFPGLTVVDQGARYIYLNGTSMASPHAAGVAALIAAAHPGWGPDAVAARLAATAAPMSCPPDWQPLFEGDERLRCYGGAGHTSFFGAGMVDADAATR